MAIDSNQTARLARKVVACCQELAKYSESEQGITRTFLSPPMHDCHRHLRNWMERLGMKVQVDAVGNLRGVWESTKSKTRKLVIGSHLDTVPNGGAYDGVLGVLLPIALIEALAGRRFSFAIEVIGFSEEEGVRFGFPFIGSRAYAGTLTQEMLEREDGKGIRLEQAIRDFGLDPQKIAEARGTDSAQAYVEFHIEQGPVLEELGLPLAVVQSIAGQTRARLQFQGKANHAGTTPMHLREDALAGAAEWISAVEREARSRAGALATVGAIYAAPGAGNVIAGEVQTTLDVRHPEDSVRQEITDRILDQACAIGTRRGLKVQTGIRLSQNAVPMDSDLVGLAERALARSGVRSHRMVSGAGHDAMIVGETIPSVMIFVRSPGGLSHHPDETVHVEDVQFALEAGLYFLDELEQTSA